MVLEWGARSPCRFDSDDSFDHRVGAQEKRLRIGEAHRFSVLRLTVRMNLVKN
jgi:hypothetical protein